MRPPSRGAVGLPVVRWECVQPEAGHNKFYEISWRWCLFPVIERRWGRIGSSRSRRRVDVCGSPMEALVRIGRHAARRKAHGYRLLAGEEDLARLIEKN